MTLAVNEISIELGASQVLWEVSAVLQAGKITAICGPNGAGKSTLLSCLSGLLEPDSGTVMLDGEGVGRLAPRDRARQIGYLPQHGEIAWDLSVRGLVALGRLPHRDTESPAGLKAISAAIESCYLTELANRPISTLSGGECARVLLARVLAGEPSWILADEPLAALDLSHQLSLLARLRSAANAGTGVVLVLHDLSLAVNHADCVLVLDRGEIASAGLPEAALDETLIARVWGVEARWLGEPGQRALIAR